MSHIPLVEQLRGHRYEKPVATMRAYLDAMDKAPYQSVPPPTKPPRVLAALGPKMLELSAERADGAHPYNVNPEHTAQARKILGPQPYLCPEQAVVLETDAEKARAIGRAFLGFYLTLPNYANNFLRLGFDEGDFKDGGSNRLIDAIVAWGDLSAIRKRIAEHHAAGADHVCIQVLTADPKGLPMPRVAGIGGPPNEISPVRACGAVRGRSLPPAAIRSRESARPDIRRLSSSPDRRGSQLIRDRDDRAGEFAAWRSVRPR